MGLVPIGKLLLFGLLFILFAPLLGYPLLIELGIIGIWPNIRFGDIGLGGGTPIALVGGGDSKFGGGRKPPALIEFRAVLACYDPMTKVGGESRLGGYCEGR